MINKLRRRLFKLLKIRPSSEPFISGDTFRKHSDFVIESIDKIDASRIKEKNVVFVNSSLLICFFTKIHPKIRFKYILISHNSDENITTNYKKFIDDKIIHWYSQNLCFKSEKVSFLPIGIENLKYFNSGLLKYFNRNNSPFLNRIFMSFNLDTNFKKRKLCYDKLIEVNIVDTPTSFLDHKTYFRKLKQYKFIVSPEGNGIDCHRTWEAIYLNIVPIVKKSDFSDNLENLPVFIVDEWEEISLLSEKDLNLIYSQKIKMLKEKAFFQHYKNTLYAV